jgi:signal peptidase II
MNYSNELANIKNRILKKKNIFFTLILIVVFTLDRISKNKILNDFNERTYFVNDFLNLDLIWNIGIGFGFLSTDTLLFYNLVTFLIGSVILILFYILITSKSIDSLIYSIIVGGACGNFYDRLVYNAVPDFIDLHYNNFHWFTFNVADIFITLGILAFIIKGFFVKNLK